MFVNVVLVYFVFMDNCTLLLFKVFLCDIDHRTFAPILTIKELYFQYVMTGKVPFVNFFSIVAIEGSLSGLHTWTH